MYWIQKGMTYGNPKWHWMPERRTVERWGYESYVVHCGEPLLLRVAREMPKGMRPALARNNVCAKCKKAYIATRPELQAAFNLLNDKKDV